MPAPAAPWRPPPSLLDDVRRRYDEPHRCYHDRRHLAAVEGNIDLLLAHSPSAVGAQAIRLAAVFHDAVYEIGRDDNEARSAALARAQLTSSGAPSSLVDEVVRLIMLTADHAPTADDAAGSVLCDADLAILGARPDAYRRYAADVRAEWAHLDDARFSAGRTAILHRLLGRPRLFGTQAAYERWEPQARRNVAEELARLAAT
jgi:predicted metal-dependent HD superfamily phosphohydrolase